MASCSTKRPVAPRSLPAAGDHWKAGAQLRSLCRTTSPNLPGSCCHWTAFVVDSFPSEMDRNTGCPATVHVFFVVVKKTCNFIVSSNEGFIFQKGKMMMHDQPSIFGGPEWQETRNRHVTNDVK